MLIALSLTVLLTTLLCETAARRGWLPYWVTRKVLHLVAVGACAFAVLLLDRALLTAVVAVAEVGLLGLIVGNRLMREESGRRAWGIVWFPLAFLLLLLVVDDDRTVFLAMLTLAVCDPAATVVGKLFPWRPYDLTGDAKTLSGSLAFAAVCALLLAALGFAPAYWLHLPLYVGLLTLSEALGSRGLDNLYVPLLTAWLLEWGAVESALPQLLFGGALLFGWVMVRRRSLDPGGAAAAVVLGSVVSLGAGPVWLLPLFVFLLSSSLIGKLLPVATAAGDAKQKQPRDAVQVVANGGVYGLLAAGAIGAVGTYGGFAPPVEALLLVAMATATADTWSSEIGQYFGRPTYDLLRGRRVPPGLSGGVSDAGSAAGLLGAGLIGGLTFVLLPNAEPVDAAWVAATGFAGMLLDSVLGSALQATYRTPAGHLTDAAGDGRVLVRGFRHMTNDLVNFLAIGLTVLLGALAYGYLG